MFGFRSHSPDIPSKSEQATSGFEMSAALDLELVKSRLTTLETEIRSVKLEWADTYDKILHLVDRLKKRQKLILEPEKSNDLGQESTSDDEGKLSISSDHASIARRYRSVRNV